MKSKKLWIAWESHRRTIELNKLFDCDLRIFESTLPMIVKHPLLLIKTWVTIHKECPDIVIVQNPSIVLTFLASILKFIYNYRLIVDAHNAGLLPTRKCFEKVNWFFTFVQRIADITIVTNEGLASTVRSNGGRPYVLPDKIPTVKAFPKIKLQGRKNVVFICTFGEDEPYWEVLKAAQILNRKTTVYITGSYGKFNKKVIEGAPSNVVFTGYLPEEEYWRLLSSSNLVVDLTFREDCLVCGAYEAIAIGVPLILSGTNALKNYFYKGATFCKNDASSIAFAIETGLKAESDLRKQLNNLRDELNFSWQEMVSPLIYFLEFGSFN